MRLNCPSCGAQYEVEDNAIPDEGRDVQCSACGHGWFQYPPVTGSASPFGAPEPFAALPVEDIPEPVVQPSPPARPQALDDIREFLRQEAAHETEQRKREQADRPLPPQREPAAVPAPVPVAVPEKQPDLAEMNSSLRPAPPRPAFDAEPDRGGFRTGFFAMVLLICLLAAGYAMAPQLAEALPATREPLLSYVTAIDTGRVWLADQMRNATSAMQR